MGTPEICQGDLSYMWNLQVIPEWGYQQLTGTNKDTIIDTMTSVIVIHLDKEYCYWIMLPACSGFRQTGEFMLGGDCMR